MAIQRKTETHCSDRAVIEDILRTAQIGSLGIIVSDGYPRVVPVNYVSEGTTVYFHGALKGEKYEALLQSSKVTFSVYTPYSVIPSFWLAEENALGATQFFKSVQINGRASVVEDVDEKARALQMLMDKYQPEGRFKAVTSAEKLYEKVLGKTLIIRIAPERVTARLKFGQNYPESTRRALIAKLEDRKQGGDLDTAAEIRRTLG